MFGLDKVKAFQREIKALTPKPELRQLGLNLLDERATIEVHSRVKNGQNIRSASPEIRHSTNLKMTVQHLSNGNLDQTYC